MSLRLAEELAREIDELFEIAAGAQLRVDLRLDGVDADAQPLQRSGQQARAHLLIEQQSIRAEACFREEADRVVDASVQQRLPHLVQPLEAQPGAVQLALGALYQP